MYADGLLLGLGLSKLHRRKQDVARGQEWWRFHVFVCNAYTCRYLYSILTFLLTGSVLLLPCALTSMSGTVPIPAITKLTAVRKHTKLVRYPNENFCGAVGVALGAVLAVISAGLMTGSDNPAWVRRCSPFTSKTQRHCHRGELWFKMHLATCTLGAKYSVAV